MMNKPVGREGLSNILTVIDEYSRYPFAFATKDRSASTVIECLNQLFSLFGPPASVHSDRGAEFLSADLRSFLARWGVHQSHTTPYHPAGNGQVERYNKAIWKTMQCILADCQLPDMAWPTVLGDALHCIRSLVSTTGSTPHDHFLYFKHHFQPHASPAKSGEYAWLRHYVCNKNKTTGDMVKILAAYPGYAVISHDGGIMSNTVNWHHLAPHPGPTISNSTDPVSIPSSPAVDTKSPTLRQLYQMKPHLLVLQ